MDTVTDVALTEFLPSALVAGATWSATRLRNRLPERWRWQLRDPARVSICVAKRLPPRRRPALAAPPFTGLGQTVALGVITPSLSRAYPGVTLPWLQFPDAITDEREGDLILLGGPKTNTLSADVLELLAERTGVTLTCDALSIPGQAVRPHDSGPAPRTEDFGVVVRMRNPWSASPRTLVLFAGAHTYGVVAAARYFVESVQPLRRRCRGDFVAVVRSDVRNDHVLPPAEIFHAPVPAR